MDKVTALIDYLKAEIIDQSDITIERRRTKTEGKEKLDE